MFPLVLMLASLGQLPPSADVRPMPVRGAVVDASGKAVAAADVWLADALSADEGICFGMELALAVQTRPSEGTLPVLVQGHAGDAGRFALEIPAEAAARRAPPTLAVWAALKEKDGRWRVGARRLPRIVLADDGPVRVEIGTDGKCEVIINGPDGKPLENARVAPVRALGLPVPGPLARKLIATTDASGRASISGLDQAALEAVRVESAAYGTQTIQDFQFNIQDSKLHNQDFQFEIQESKLNTHNFKPRLPDSQGPMTLALAPVGRVEGRLTFPQGDRAPVHGVKVHATSYVEGHEGSGRTGETVVDCDEEGHFTIPAIAAGVLMLEFEFGPEAAPTERVGAIGARVLRPGRTLRVAPPTSTTIQARGSYREQGTKRPIAGVKVMLRTSKPSFNDAVTDVRGEFQARVARGPERLLCFLVRVPAPFFRSGNAVQIMAAPIASDVETRFPPVDVRRGVDLAGTVEGDDGRPVAGALVEAAWDSGARALTKQAAVSRSDRAGNFVLHGMDPDAELTIRAWDGFAASPAVSFQPDPLRPRRAVVLKLNPKFAAPLAGKVVDSEGRPIVGARVRLHRHLKYQDDDDHLLADIVAANGDDRSFDLRTDAHGRFRARRRFPTHYIYDAVAIAPGHLAARAVIATPGKPLQKPAELALPRLRAVSGTVVDRQGKPIAGALVFQSGDGPFPTETRSAADGRFLLPGVLEGPAVVFVQKDGFRRAFVECSDDAKGKGQGNGPSPLKIVMARSDEPPVVSYKTLPPTLPADEEFALALRLLEPMIERAMTGNANEKYRVFQKAVLVDPLGVSRRLKDFELDKPGPIGDAARTFLFHELMDDHKDRTAEMLEHEPSVDVRAECYLAIRERHLELPDEEARGFLERAEKNARSMNDPIRRPGIEARLAESWLDLSEPRRARALIDEAMRQCEPRKLMQSYLGIDGLCNITVSLALTDLPAARRLMDQIERDAAQMPGRRGLVPFSTYYANIAFRLATKIPAEAEAVLERTTPGPGDAHYLAEICGAMASKDPGRARRIAEKWTDPGSTSSRPLALGLMAFALAKGGGRQKAEALRWLDEAFGLLEKIAENDVPSRSSLDPGAEAIGAALLPVVEHIDPDRLAECLARVLAMRPRRGGASWNGMGDGNLVGPSRLYNALPRLLARYDRGLAEHALENEERDLLDRYSALGASLSPLYTLTARAMIDPTRAVAQVEALPEPAAPDARTQRNHELIRSEVAHILAKHGAERWRLVRQQSLRLWEPGPLGL